ncbi:MAG: molecular chaperone HscB [Bacteroidia bacterium]|jgi:molecular chaperone HscB
MSSPDFKKNYFELFDLCVDFAVDKSRLGERFRQLQGELHPDKHAGASERDQRLAVQYSSLVNQAYTTLRKPLPRALYLLELAGIGAEQVAKQHVDGGFLIVQIDLREKLETMAELVEPEPVLDHLLTEIEVDVRELQAVFASSYTAGNYTLAAEACVKMQYLDKLHQEAEQIESDLMDKGS